MTFGELARAVRAYVDLEDRYAHVVRVARTAERLAFAHGEPPARARLAGMLHDLARLYPPERLLEECTARKMAIDAFERANPIVLHARLSAELARERFGVADEGVLSAIRMHTVAAPGMSRLDKILYLADALEPGRTYPERASLLALAFADPDAALRGVLRSTLGYLRARGLHPAPGTLAALAELEREEAGALQAKRAFSA
jgi:predicted HD superfamily hydrolase involved in NAD metabolism